MSQDNIKPIVLKKTPSRFRLFSQPAFSTSLRDRPVVFQTQHIDDLGRKHSFDMTARRVSQLDECSLQMTNDPNSCFYRRLNEVLKPPTVIQTPSNEEEEKLKLFEKYGPELVEFLKDKDGQIKPKFDKVFIT